MATTKTDTNEYVNNKKFLAAIVEYKKACRKAKREKLPKPKIPDFIGKQLLLIAENLSHKPNFSQYTFVEDMKGDSVENAILYFDNFDPKRTKYPFTYFTKIIYYAFIRRIKKEKRALYIKYKATVQQGTLHEGEMGDEDNPGQFDLHSNITDFIAKYEDSEEKSKAKKKLPKKKK